MATEDRKIIEVKASKKLMDALDEVHREEQESGNDDADMDDPLFECIICRKETRESNLDKGGMCRSCGGG